MTEMADLSTWKILGLLDSMAARQQVKVLALAQTLVPGITAEDARNPHDFPALKTCDAFNFEDGILSGLLAARMAIAAELSLTTTRSADLPHSD